MKLVTKDEAFMTDEEVCAVAGHQVVGMVQKVGKSRNFYKKKVGIFNSKVEKSRNNIIFLPEQGKRTIIWTILMTHTHKKGFIKWPPFTAGFLIFQNYF